MQNIPKVIQYGNVKPRGFATKYKRWEVNPQSSFNSFSSNELLRFQLQTDGWIDPYASFMQIEVETNATLCGASQTTQPVHLELDGQSTSLISSLIIYSDSKELERIDEYDQLGQILSDIGMSSLNKASKTYEGMSFESCYANQAQICNGGQCQQFLVAENNPTEGSKYSIGKSYFRATNVIDYTRAYAEGGPMTGVLPLGHAQTYLNTSLPRNKTVAEYDAILGLDGLDTEFGVEHLFNKCQGPNESNPSYQNCIQCGLKAPTSFALSGNKSQYINDNVNTLKLINGKCVQNRAVDDILNKVPQSFVKKQRFLVPILSGVLGILIPSDQWKLIPGKALKNLLIEIRLNPYAFFTSSQYFGTALAKRGWRITSFKLMFDIWNFDEAVERYMDQQLSGEGIILSSQSWSMGPMYQIIANGSPTNNWQINNGIESAKNVIFWFLANDYLTYPQCRKQFRLSMNVLQYQLKIGGEFIPQQPIKGHAGNIAMNDVILDENTEFLVELHKTFGFLFSAERKTDINKLNFAVNDRSYDPNMENMSSSQLGLAGTAGDNPVRGQGLSLYEERRLQGKAVYALNLDSNPHDPDVLSGLDTTQKRPVELVVKGADTDKFTRDATMYVMINHDFYVQFTLNGTKTYGQG